MDIKRTTIVLEASAATFSAAAPSFAASEPAKSSRLRELWENSYSFTGWGISSNDDLDHPCERHDIDGWCTLAEACPGTQAGPDLTFRLLGASS